MKVKYVPLTTVFILISILPCAQADGILIPVRQPKGNVFSVKYHHVDVHIETQAATTRVDQMFHNDTAIEEEGTYVFPLPKGAAINKFSMFIGEKEAEGRILDKDEARRMYESIVRRRKDPALLEYIDNNTFRARVYPIPPNGDKRIRLQYTEVISRSGNLCRYTYPLSTERFSSKPLDDCHVTIHLKASAGISNIYSPSHVVKIEQSSPNEALVTWSARNVKPDTDLVLYYSLAPKGLALDVMAFKDEKGRGYFMALASPHVGENRRVLPKTVVFVLDRTGSMAGEKIIQAKEALRYCLNSLKSEDRFNLIVFNESPAPLFDAPRPASRTNVREATDVVDRIEASGGTNLHEAVVTALRQMSQDDSSTTLRFVVLLTDGQPTAGETNPEKILDDARRANTAHARLFTFGVGYDVNTHLLDLLAEQNNGMSEYVLPNENIEVKVSSFFSSVSEPILTDLGFTVKGVRVSDIYPIKLPDLFKGGQLVVTGRYEGSGKAVFALSGKNHGELKIWSTTIDMNGKDPDKDFIPLIWAARRIGYLLDQVRLHRSDELIKEIVLLSKEWGIPTEFTSFFVEDDGIIPLNQAMERASVYAERARVAKSGSWGVAQSMNSAMLKTQVQVPANGPMSPPSANGTGLGNVRGFLDAEGKPVLVTRVQNIGTRTFYLRGNQWVDQQSENQNLKTIRIKQFSNAHFKLLAAYPELAKYQKLGNIRLFVNNQALEIGPDGKDELTESELRGILGNTKADLGSTTASTETRSKLTNYRIVAMPVSLAMLPIASAFARRRAKSN